ncbi:MAG: hypothetical protein PVH61_35505 [Candidatus Aminicenantes bacterium]
MRRKSLSSFDSEKDSWYYQEKIYIDPKSDDSLYNELKEFRQSLTKELDTGINPVDYPDFFSEPEKDERNRRSTGNTPEEHSTGAASKGDSLNTGGFFDGKLQLLREEIEDINRNLEERQTIEKQSEVSIDEEIEQVKQRLHDIYTWKEPSKQTIEFIRMDLLKQLASLNREKRQSGLGFWKDRVFEKRDRRNLLFEYKSLNWTGEFSRNKGKEEHK